MLKELCISLIFSHFVVSNQYSYLSLVMHIFYANFAAHNRAQGVDYFFDRHYLKGGDVYPIKIREYIDSADLFILCWSKNAAESEYVTLERRQAMALAYPQVAMEKATITIHPISIEPRAEYPVDMKKWYNFEEV